MRSKRFFGASCTAQKMAEQCTLNRMYSRMNLHALEKRKFEYSLKKLKREKSFIDFLININVKLSYTYLLLYAHEKQWISRCAHRHGSSIYRLLFKNYFYFWAQEALSCNGVCVNQNRAVFLDGYSNRYRSGVFRRKRFVTLKTDDPRPVLGSSVWFASTG